MTCFQRRPRSRVRPKQQHPTPTPRLHRRGTCCPRTCPALLLTLMIANSIPCLPAVIDEVRRRGQLTPILKARLVEATQSADRSPKPHTPGSATTGRHQETDAEGAHPLTVGQTNAVRAAFMAGVKPSVIARQFGISQSAIKKALSSDTRA